MTLAEKSGCGSDKFLEFLKGISSPLREHNAYSTLLILA
jgi:hypothetical protein